MSRYNVAKLDRELRAAGLPIQGCDSTGRVVWDMDPTSAQRAKADAVLAAHDSSLTLQQALAAAGVDETEAAFRLLQMKGPLAPQWAKDLANAYIQRITEIVG